VYVQVDPDEIDERARSHGPAGTGRHRRVEIVGRDPCLIEDANAVVEKRNQDAVDDEAGGVVAPDRLLPEPLSDRVRGVDRLVGGKLRAHDLDESLSASVLLENLACKATGALALEHLLAHTGFPADELQYVIGSGEEAVGDRYQRGGGNLGKAIAEQAGCVNASGSDVKAFCAGPIHALVVAGSLVSAGVYGHVAVVAGGSLAKLGMKFAGALRHDVPVLEDVLAGLAILVGPAGDGAPAIRLDAVGRHRVGSGSAQQAVLEDLVVEPLERLGRKITDVERYATELHDPEITEPAGAGNVPQRNYKLMGALAVRRGEIPRDALDSFEREHGLPGFSPTQGHVASAVPWLPHGLEALRSGEIGSTMLVAKGSLFLGRMTELADGMSILLEPGKE